MVEISMCCSSAFGVVDLLVLLERAAHLRVRRRSFNSANSSLLEFFFYCRQICVCHMRSHTVLHSSLCTRAGSQYRSCVRNRLDVLVVACRRPLRAVRCLQWHRFFVLHNGQRTDQSARRWRLVCGLLSHVSAARGLRMRHSTRSHRTFSLSAVSCPLPVVQYTVQVQHLNQSHDTEKYAPF